MGMLNAGMSATVVSLHFTGNVADRPLSGRLLVTTAADDRYIVLQHLCNRHLTAAAAGRQYGILPQTVRNRLREKVQPIRAYQPYFGQILTRRHRTARRDWCRLHLHFRRADWDLILFSDECRLAIPTDAREFIAVGESVCHRAGPFRRWYNISLDWDNGR